MKQLPIAAGLGMLLALGACGTGHDTAKLTKSGLNPENFKAEYRGDSTALYTLTNQKGTEACITNFGGRLVSLMVADKNGKMQDVVLGFDSVQAYFPENNLSDFGASIGRYANRINQGQFVIDGDTIQLPRNNYGHCLHGGGELGDYGWQYRVYQARQLNDSTLELTMKSPDGDNKFPGNLTAVVTYTLRNDNALDIKYSATTDKPTIVNLTNHSYFNLSGDPSHPVTDNLLQVVASGYTPVDSTYMTTGEIASVEGTPFDFRTPSQLGTHIKDFSNEQIKNGNGYDHNFVLDNNCDINTLAASLYSPTSGIQMDVYTNEPGIQIYSGNFLDGSVTGKKGKVYQQHDAICLETQHYPDSPNKPQWPSVRLNPGETYNSECIYKFSVKQ
jgi:aldose 1-epimerase